jgi:hypothetical protein
MVVMPYKLDEQRELEKEVWHVKLEKRLLDHKAKSKSDLDYSVGLLMMPFIFVQVLFRKIFGGDNDGSEK